MRRMGVGRIVVCVLLCLPMVAGAQTPLPFTIRVTPSPPLRPMPAECFVQCPQSQVSYQCTNLCGGDVDACRAETAHWRFDGFPAPFCGAEYALCLRACSTPTMRQVRTRKLSDP